MEPLHDYLEEMRSHGQTDSSGTFALDIRKAREKLGAFFNAKACDFLHYWVRFAIFQGASKVLIRHASDEISLEYSGTYPDEEEIRSLFGQAGLGQRYLQMAVVGALAQGFSRVQLATPLYLAEFESESQALHPNTSTECRLSARPTKAAWATRLMGKSPLTLQEFTYSTVPIFVNGSLQSQRAPTERAVFTTSARWAEVAGEEAHVYQARTELSTRLSLIFLPAGSKDQSQSCQLRLVVQGASLDAGEFDVSAFPPDTELVVEVAEARLDLSLRKVIRPGLSPEILRQVQDDLCQLILDCLDQDAALLQALPLDLADWLIDALCRRDRREEALRICQGLVHKRLLVEPEVATRPLVRVGLLERTWLLYLAVTGSPEAVAKNAAKRYWSWLLQSPALPDLWAAAVERGIVRAPDLAWLEPTFGALRGPFVLDFYRETLRESVFPLTVDAEFFKHLRGYRKDTFLGNYLLARYLLARPSREIPLAEVVYCVGLLIATVSGLEPAPDFSDAHEQLGRAEKSLLYVMLVQLCRHGIEGVEAQMSPVGDVGWELKFKLRLSLAACLRLAGLSEEAVGVLNLLLPEARADAQRAVPRLQSSERDWLQREIGEHGLSS